MVVHAILGRLAKLLLAASLGTEEKSLQQIQVAVQAALSLGHKTQKMQWC